MPPYLANGIAYTLATAGWTDSQDGEGRDSPQTNADSTLIGADFFPNLRESANR